MTDVLPRGTVLVLIAKFTAPTIDATGEPGVHQPIDPDAVSLIVKTPGNATTTYTYGVDNIVRLGEGIYTFDLPLPTAGTWDYTWVSTGNGQAATPREHISVSANTLLP